MGRLNAFVSPPASRSPLPRSIIILGVVSMMMDISSEMIHSLLPVFMVSVLGSSLTLVGVMEGLAESIALIVRIFSGALSDKIGKRKQIALIGYSIGALSKPLFALATSTPLVFFARLCDRLGKGIRAAPRDALITDLTPKAQRGHAFGLRQSLDTIGAILGPCFAFILISLLPGQFSIVFAIAALPALLCVILFYLGVSDAKETTKNQSPLSLTMLSSLPARFWMIALVALLATLARFSEAFILLKAYESHVGLAYTPLYLVAMNLAYALIAYPAGKRADEKHPASILMLGIIVLMVANLTLGLTQHPLSVLIGSILWGLHMGLTQGIFAMLISNAAPTNLIATAFGLFNFITGIAMLLASTIAGLLWDSYGSSYTFLTSVFFSFAALLLLLTQKPYKTEGVSFP